MLNFNTRTRIVIASIILTISFILLQQIDFQQALKLELNFDPVRPIILSIMTYLMCYWVLHFKVSGERFVTILLFPSITVFALTLLSEILIAGVFSSYGQVGLLVVSAVIFGISNYVTLLTINVLNVSYLKEIPLGQAGRASQFVITMLIAYVSFFILFSNEVFFVFKELFILFLTFLLVYISLWSIQISKKQRIVASLDIAILVTMLAFILSLWPINSTYISLVLILVFYSCLGIALEIRDIINRVIWIEYVSLLVLIFITLFLLAEWGINGHLL